MDGARIAIVSIPVSDQSRAKEFYCQGLGFLPLLDTTFEQDGRTQRWVMLGLPDGGTAITLVTWFETMPAGALRGMVVSVSDIERAARDLASRGVAGAESPIQESPWGRWITVEDPDGNAWVIQQDRLPAGHTASL